MSNAHRAETGGNIDRKTPINFTFNNIKYTGYSGDTLASALLANGIHWVGRSFKSHRPMGIISADVCEPNAIIQLEKGGQDSKPNILATEVLLYQDLKAHSVNVWPSLKFDVIAIHKYFSKYLTTGFYYKTFMWPKSFWKKFYEPVIRKRAGLGICELNRETQAHDRIDKHCELLIVGSGPAGLAALEQASKLKTKIILADENPSLGSTLIGTKKHIWAQEIIKSAAKLKNIILLEHTTIFGYYESNYICGRQYLTHGQRIWHIHADRVILATGAHERPITFYNNYVPGIMLASAANRYLLQYGVLCGKNIMIFTNNDSVYSVVANLLAKNANILGIVDSRANAPDVKIDIPIYKKEVVAFASGKKHIKSITLSSGLTIKCDLLLVSGGFNPVVHLFSQSGGSLQYCNTRSCFIPNSSTQELSNIGACAGIFDEEECIVSGQKAAHKQAFIPDVIPKISAIWDISSGLKNDTGKHHLIDFNEEVSVADIKLAAREGMDSIELVKRYTTVGMGMDQGKLSNVNAIGVLSEYINKPIPEVGTTKFRAPYTPISFASLAGTELGDLLDPVRTTTIHERHLQYGAVFEDVGQWKRPWYYPKPNESMQDTLNRECLAVHQSVGMLDASTLGKIDIQGKDAGVFLDLIYTNLFSSLKRGVCRYGIMCHEDGMVFDDGITSCIGENHYYMTTTTSGAAAVLDWMEYWLQTQYPDLEVFLTSITEQYGTVVVSGPNSRSVMQDVFKDHSFDAYSFPFMRIQDAMLLGVPVKILRISFTGELSFEIHYPSHLGPKVWDLVANAGAPFNITPYGTETMHILRAQKGFIIVGQDTDGSVTPSDLNMNWIISKKKDFLGKRSFQLKNLVKKDRKIMVGLITKNPKTVIPEGAQLVIDPKHPKPIPMEGHVTSSYYSPILGKSIALALIKDGLNRIGETLYAPVENQIIETTIVSSIFYDQDGERQNV
ncbi:MAG: sarcosine oxidase subunit alpha family protein [Legionellaceae bacterium]|nr:sarcosine oxidase subunit alpha family protein [Legionellaceae bacterium]